MSEIEDLYTAKDTARIREYLLKQQENLDACTLLEIPQKQACLDHLHDSEQLVRGVLHRQVNAYIGKLENNYIRMLAWWYPNDLPTFLEQAADYLRRKPLPYRHPNWIAKLKVEFNKLNSKQMKQVLEHFGYADGKNLKERKGVFTKIVLDRSTGFDTIKAVIEQAKGTDG